MGGYNVEKEIELLVIEMKRLATEKDGKYYTTFGTIFNDDKIQNTLESLVGTLKAGKKRGVLDFKGEMLLQGVHNNVEVVLLKPDYKAAE